MARRFEDDVLVTVFEVDTDEWLKEVQVGSGQNSNCPCDFCSPGNDDKLGRVRRLVFDRFFNRRYGKVGVCGKCFKRWYSFTLEPRVFDENVFSKNCRMVLAVKRRNCGNLLNFLQNREVGGGFGLFGGRKFECCKIKKVQCQSVCREVCPDNPCLDENTLWAKHPYAMLSSRIYPCEGEIKHLQKVQKRYMEQFGVPEGFNPSEDFESRHGEAWCQAVDAYMLWKSVAEQCGCLTPHNCFDEHGHWFGEFVNYV